MSIHNQFLTRLQELLPENLINSVNSLAETIIKPDTQMKLVLLGAFSVGKSSLLNMLIQEHLLQTALEETTALPTFIEHGVQRSMQLIDTRGSVSTLSIDEFKQATTQAPENAACAVLALPLDWLRDLQIIDLPGLGSMSASNHAYTLAQIQQADAVLYLLDVRGPTQTDIDILQTIRQRGKRVKIMVTRWDDVEAAVTRGEKAPDLERWSSQIEAGTGIKARIAPCHYKGLGRDDVLDFLERTKTDLNDIRWRRFRAELKPVLENAAGLNVEQYRSCEAVSEEAAQELHQELMQRKNALSEFKSGLHDQEQQDRQRIQAHSQALQTQVRQPLTVSLRQEVSHLHDETGWDEFTTQGHRILHEALSAFAAQLSQLSTDYGQINLPPHQIADLNMRIPAPETIDSGDFLDAAKMTQVQHELERCKETTAAIEQKLSSMSIQDMSESDRALQQLLQQRHQISAEPLPRIVQKIDSGSSMATAGRFIGEIADIGLMFVNPTMVGTKVAALAGKGAKMATTVAKGVKVAQALQTGRRIPGVPPPVMEKLGALEFLSLGYWGERIGAALDGSPREEEIIDPAAQAEQTQALAALDAQIQSLRRDLARNEDIANERQLTGWALEQNRKEHARLEADLARRTQQAEQKKRDAQELARQERHEMLLRMADRATTRWLTSFDQQTGSMIEVLRVHVKNHWDNRVGSLVDERMQEIENLAARTNQDAQQKTAMLASLRREADGIAEAIRLEQTLA